MLRSAAAALLALLAAANAHAGEVRVFAAASLARPFQQALAALGDEPSLRLNFAGSQQLALQLSQGASADVFASADERWMDEVRRQGLLAGDPRPFARNRMVVITPASDPGRIAGLADLARPGVKLVLAADAVPAGRYSREVLARLATDAAFGPEFTRRALANVVSEEESVQAVVTRVQLGEADAGMVYTSDVAALPGRLRGLEIPAAANVEARYLVGILAAAPNPSGARAFVDWLLSPVGQKLLADNGFLTAAP